MSKKTVRGVVLAALLAVSPYGYSADTATNKNVNDVLNILVGAYNGAARAAAENNGTTAQTISRADLAPLENRLSRYQQDLQSLVAEDGSINAAQLGQLLNRLQNEQQGSISYDFAQAFRALDNASSQDGAKGLFDPQLISELVGAAKNRELKNDLGEAAPYLGAVLQIGALMSQQDHPDSAALSAEVQAFKALAERFQATPGLAGDVSKVAAQLKILYADQALGEKPDAGQVKLVRQELQLLQQRVMAAKPQSLPTASYDEILKPLKALGKPFADELENWQILQTISMKEESRHAPSAGFDAPTRKLLDALNYDSLPPHVQKELLERLNIRP